MEGIRRASVQLRILYCLALLSCFPAMLVMASGWIGLMTGMGFVGRAGATVFLLVFAAALFRIYEVARYAWKLDAGPVGGGAAVARGLAILLMLAGVLACAGLFFVGPVTRAIFGSAGDAGIGYVVTSFFLALATPLGWAGCLLFEGSRRFGRAAGDRPKPRTRQDMAVLAGLVVLSLAAPQLIKSVTPVPCGEGDLGACVSKTEGGVQRMVPLAVGTPVHLASAIDEIHLRRGSAWEIVESPAASLKAAGFPPTAGPDARIKVRLQPVAGGAGAAFSLSVSDGDVETAKFIVRFAEGALEPGAAGKSNLVVKVPSNSESGMRSVLGPGSNNSQYMRDHVYYLLRRALGTEVEARENEMRLERVARLVSHSDAELPLEFLKNKPGASVDLRCADRITATRGAASASAPLSMGSELYDLAFADAAGAPPHAHMHMQDQLVCTGQHAWLISYPVRRPDIVLKQYSMDGKLLLFVETRLPPRPDDDFDLIDPGSLAIDGRRLRFARVLGDAAAAGLRERGRDIFEVDL